VFSVLFSYNAHQVPFHRIVLPTASFLQNTFFCPDNWSETNNNVRLNCMFVASDFKGSPPSVVVPQDNEWRRMNRKSVTYLSHTQ